MAKTESKWKFPPTHKIETVKDLFIQLAAVNENSKSFSHRALAGRLKWPVSYIPDLIRGRKKFTIRRCMQLLHYFSADPLDSERIIFLSLSDYFPDSKPFQRQLKNRSLMEVPQTIDFSMLELEIMLVMNAFYWFQGSATFPEIERLLKRCRIPPQKLRETLTFLKERKILRQKGSLYVCMQTPSMMSQDIGLESNFFKIHQAFADNYKKLIDPPVSPGFVNSNLIFLHPEKVKEVYEKLFAFRNWLQEMSADEIEKPSAPDLLLFQFDLNLLPIFEKEEAKALARKTT